MVCDDRADTLRRPTDFALRFLCVFGPSFWFHFVVVFQRVAGCGSAGKHSHANNASFHDLRDGEDPSQGALTRPDLILELRVRLWRCFPRRLIQTPLQPCVIDFGVSSNKFTMLNAAPMWRNGRRNGLKIRWAITGPCRFESGHRQVSSADCGKRKGSLKSILERLDNV